MGSREPNVRRPRALALGALVGMGAVACRATSPAEPAAARPQPIAEPTVSVLNSARLPDFAWTGYHAGDQPPPSVPVVENAKLLGAVGDGVTDDTAALQAALDATHDGALLLPAGRYVIRDTLHIERSHVVLRGAGPDETVLVIPESLSQIHAPAAGSENAFAYGGGFVEVRGALRGETLGEVVTPARRGERRLVTRAPIAAKPGDLVRLRMGASPDLLREIQGGAEPGAQTPRDFEHYVDWVVPVAGVEDSTLLLARPLRVDVRPAWQAEIVAFEPTVEDVGVEALSFEFAGVPKKAHNEEEGFNAVFMHDVAQSWVRDVTVVDADNGVFLAKCRFCQVERVTFRTARRAAPSGHHALWAKESEDCLFAEFRIETVYEHDLSVEGFANGNVFMRGSAQSLSLDHHRNAPYENLFTDLDAGRPERLFRSGGDVSRGPHAGVRETLWNVRHRGQPPPLPGALHWDHPGDAGWPELNLVQVAGYAPTSERSNVWVSAAPGAPPNLYAAQREARWAARR